MHSKKKNSPHGVCVIPQACTKKPTHTWRLWGKSILVQSSDPPPPPTPLHNSRIRQLLLWYAIKRRKFSAAEIDNEEYEGYHLRSPKQLCVCQTFDFVIRQRRNPSNPLHHSSGSGSCCLPHQVTMDGELSNCPGRFLVPHFRIYLTFNIKEQRGSKCAHWA